MILDEPTTGLDPQARVMIWKRLLDLKRQGKTLLLTTHYMDEAQRLCDEIIVIDHGRILDRGAPQELIDRHVKGHVFEVQKPLPSGFRDGRWEHEDIGDAILYYVDAPRAFTQDLPEDVVYLAPPGQSRGRVPAPDRPPAARELMHEARAIARHSLAVTRRQYLVWRKVIWSSLTTNVANPILFLFAFGFGLGAVVDRMAGLGYLAFVVPGMMAYSAMFAASFETTIGSFARLRLPEDLGCHARDAGDLAGAAAGRGVLGDLQGDALGGLRARRGRALGRRRLARRRPCSACR